VKRLVLALVCLALGGSGCALGEPLPPTDVGEGGITLNANISSSVDGDMDYWFRYGPRGQSAGWTETLRERLRIDSRDPVRVAQVLDDLTPDTRYGWQVCAADEEEDPAREVCSKEQIFGTVGDQLLVLAGPLGSGTVTMIVSARSGPDGENPSGFVQPDAAEDPQYGVTCLRVSGTHASVGYEGGFLQYDRSGTNEGSVTFEELAGRDPTACPTPTPEAGATAIGGLVSIDDAP
jgi:hypothetical protein